MKIYPKPRAVMISELIGDKRATPQFVNDILRTLPPNEQFGVKNCSRDVLVDLLSGEYPESPFYIRLKEALEVPELNVSEELRRVLLHLDPETLLVNDVELLKALEIVMTLPIRRIVSELDDDLLAIVCDGLMAEGRTACGTYRGVTVTVEVSPALDTFLELLFHIVETRT